MKPVIGMCGRRLRLAAGPAVLAAILVAAGAVYLASAPSSVSAHHLCPNTGSPFGAFNIDTYEAAQYKDLYARTFELGAFNKIAPEQPGFALPGIQTGPRSAGSSTVANPYIPPVILKSIAFLESGWAQASYDPAVQYGEVGPVLSSHDCGYGLMQVTTGMQNVSNVPNIEQAMIGTHYAFNVARGARILAEKWNMSPEHRPIVGERDPNLLENWYYALWGYNGFAFSNHPLNPAYSTNRVPYSCGPTNDGYGHDRSQYPYQELVLGCVERPPTRAGSHLWNSIPVHLPELNNPAFAGPLNTANWNACSYNLNCSPMDIPTPNAFHTDGTTITVPREQVMGQPSMTLDQTAMSLSLNSSNPIATVSLKVNNAGTGILGYQAITPSTWLKVAGGGAGVALGDELGGYDGTITLLADATGQAPGDYTGSVTVNSLYASGAPQTLTINMSLGPVTTPAPVLGKWGDNDCSGVPADPVDALLVLRNDAGLVANTNGCPGMGWILGNLIWGDIDCMDGLIPTDALKTLRANLGEPIEQYGACPAVGATVNLVP
ncbi:MAG TPA: hypothetical protein VMR52_10375 [Dehalococcoidia bacterium]|nr:hypothetical protein [Dehalococcoidia bacterium]